MQKECWYPRQDLFRADTNQPPEVADTHLLVGERYSVTDAMEEAEVSKHVAIDVYQWLREICSTRLTSQNIQLGGPGSIVQIDESLFRHKPKVKKPQTNTLAF